MQRVDGRMGQKPHRQLTLSVVKKVLSTPTDGSGYSSYFDHTVLSSFAIFFFLVHFWSYARGN